MTISALMAKIEETLPEGGDWCSLDKAQTLAAMVLARRPETIVEIGVWLGGSLVPMLLTLRYLAETPESSQTQRRAIAIDPWSAQASCDGQINADRAWWASVDHDAVYRQFIDRIGRLGLTAFCDIQRTRSDEAPIPPAIGLLHIDGNHAEQAVRDVERFAPAVSPGGILVLDDVSWTGGYVTRALGRATELGFDLRYPLGTGMVLQRSR